jgi:cytochrome oxidase Cu insertion factor (SCO1/SenC/PrrC family)
MRNLSADRLTPVLDWPGRPVVSTKRLSFVLAAALLTATLMSAAVPPPESAQARQPVDVARLGPQVGERVPDFTLTDQNGKTWTLQSIMGPNGAMLVFFRSADW